MICNENAIVSCMDILAVNFKSTVQIFMYIMCVLFIYFW